MNNAMVVGGMVVVVLIGGLVVYSVSTTNTPSGTATSTTETTTTTTVNTGSSKTVAAGVPVVTTSTLVVVSNSIAVVTGKVTPNGAQTSYWYDYGRTNALNTRTATQPIGGGFITTSAPTIISGLSANTTYFYRLSAQNAYGTTVGQSLSFTTNTSPPLQGIGPTTRTDAVSLITRISATLNGQVTPNNSEATYWFEYGETADLGNTTALQSAGNGTTTKAVSAVLNNLTPLTKYYFRLNAQNQFGTMTGGITNFTTSGPVASSAPTVTTNDPGNIATSSVTMRGRLNPNSYPTTYWFEYGTERLLGNSVGSSTRTELTGSATVTVSVSADIKNLSKNSKYYYQLVATNSFGTIRGDIVAFTTKR